jgi:hypothetical protein
VVKAVHTVAFLVELGSIFWLVLTGFMSRRDQSVAVAAGAVAIEAAVFIANRGVCPLTPVAERLGAAKGSVSDIFLPEAVARTIPYLVERARPHRGRAARSRIAESLQNDRSQESVWHMSLWSGRVSLFSSTICSK